MRTALEHIAIELEKRNAFKLYEIESKRDEEKAYKELKDKLNKIDEQSNDGYISSDAHIIADEIENGADEIKGEMLFAVSKLQDLSMDLSEINEIMNRQWNAEYGDRVKQKEQNGKNQKDNEKVNRNHNNVNKKVSDKSHESKEMVMTENETNITRILHAMMYGVDKDAQKSELMSITGILLYDVERGLLPVEVAMDAVENIGKKCTPPMEEEEIVNVWNEVFDYYN